SGFIRDSGYAPTDFAPALGADDNYVTNAEKILLSNTSGINTGDQDLSSYATKEYVDNLPQGYGGWLEEGLDGVIVTRESTDDPTVVLRFDADVRDYIWKGMRIKATENSIVHYF